MRNDSLRRGGKIMFKKEKALVFGNVFVYPKGKSVFSDE